MADRQRIASAGLYFMMHPEILQHQEAGPCAPAGASR
jgi:hypothetical protein